MKTITSKDNALIKEIQKLKSRKGRQKSNEFILDGYRIVQHAIEYDADISHVLVTERFLDDHEWHYEGSTIKVTHEIMKLLVETETPQGIIAIVKTSSQALGDGSIRFLDQVQDPGNMGTLIRTAEAAGFSGVMLRKGCVDPYSQKSIRSSMGSIVSIPIYMNATIEDLIALDRRILGAALEGGKSYRDVDYDLECVLVIGNEGNGISKEVLEKVHERIYIPMKGEVESLNASIAGGILMFEIAACTS